MTFQQGDVARDLSEAACINAAMGHQRCQMVAMGVPRRAGFGKRQLFGELGSEFRPTRPVGCQRAGRPRTEAEALRRTPATSRANALAVVENIRRQYQACLTAYAAQAKYTKDLNTYNAAKAAYKQRWGDLKPHRLSKNRGTVHPPAPFTETQPTTPSGCPGPPGTSGGTGAGGSS